MGHVVAVVGHYAVVIVLTFLAQILPVIEADDAVAVLTLVVHYAMAVRTYLDRILRVLEIDAVALLVDEMVDEMADVVVLNPVLVDLTVRSHVLRSPIADHIAAMVAAIAS